MSEGRTAADVIVTEQLAAIEGEARLGQLVYGFAQNLLQKLVVSEKKYGWNGGWREAGWMDECRAKLREHIEKGDPLDVAAYCVFLWYHGEGTK